VDGRFIIKPFNLATSVFVGNQGQGVVRLEQLAGDEVASLSEWERARLHEVLGPAWRRYFTIDYAAAACAD
jgi:hypothetical protein